MADICRHSEIRRQILLEIIRGESEHYHSPNGWKEVWQRKGKSINLYLIELELRHRLRKEGVDILPQWTDPNRKEFVINQMEDSSHWEDFEDIRTIWKE